MSSILVIFSFTHKKTSLIPRERCGMSEAIPRERRVDP